MSGFVDYWRMSMGWWSSVEATPVSLGPFCFQAVQVFSSGAVETSMFSGGAERVGVFSGGVDESQVGCS